MPRRRTTTARPKDEPAARTENPMFFKRGTTGAARTAYNMFTLELEDIDMLLAHLIARLEAVYDDASDDAAADELRALTLIAEHVRDRQRRLKTPVDVLLDEGAPVGARQRNARPDQADVLVS